jgi:prepilin-type N-terminal cleavage/methylation domain-containing protein
MKIHSARAHGFTLVEIMIVVVIVGVLSAIAVPAMMHAKKKSQDTQVMHTLRQLYDAKEAYFTEDGAGKVVIRLSALVKAGYASNSLDAITQHDLGPWHLTSLRGFPLKPGESIKLTESFKRGHTVTYGRVLAYP